MIKLNIKNETAQKLKTIGIVLLSIVVIIYAAFLLILPNIIDLNKFTPQISKEVEKLSGLKFDAKNLKLKTTYKFGIKLAAESIGLKYKDDAPLLDLKAPEIEVNLPTILIGHINLDTIKAQSADIYLTFSKEKKYTIKDYIETALKNSGAQEPKTGTEGLNFPLEIRNINISAEKIALHLYDENVDKTYLTQLDNSSLLMKSLSGPLQIKTTGFIGVEGTDTKFVNVDVDFKTKLPKVTEQAQGAQNEMITELPDFPINPVKTLEDFNLNTNIKVDLDIKDIEDFKAKGNIDIDKFSLKLSDYQLPNSTLNVAFKDRNIDTNANVYISKDEFLNAKGHVKTGKKGNLDLDVKTDKITLKSLFKIVSAVLDICLIENDMANLTANGYITSNFKVSTDYKTVKSSGALKLIDGDISYPKANIKISNIGSFLDFSDNSLQIKDTSASVNGAKFSVKGEIAQNADINLNVQSDPMKVKDLVALAQEFKIVNPKDIRDYEFKDGLLTVLVNVLGNFNNIQPKADIDLTNLNLLVKSMNMPVGIENIKITARPKGKDDIDANVNVKNVTAKMPNPLLRFSAPSVKLALDMKNIKIEPLNAALEGTKINLSGNISEYMTNPVLDLKVGGNVHPNTVFAFIPKEFRKGITYRGAMPYNALITGTLDNIKVDGNLVSNPSNYIGVVDIPSVKGLENTLSFNLAVKNDVVDLTDAAVKSQSGRLAGAKGVIKNIYAPEPIFSNFNISLPNKTYIIVPMLAGTSFSADGGLTLNGRAFSPEMTGNINVTGLNYPDFGFTLESLILNFNKTILSAKANGAKVAKSDFAGDANISTNFTKNITINSLNFNSNYIDTDALIQLADKAMKAMPQAPAGTSSAPSDLGIILKTGHASIGKLKSGTLFVENIAYDHTLLNNTYNLNNLSAVFANGKAQGKCNYGILNGKIGVDMQADGISMKDAAKAFIGKEIIKAGTLSGKAKLTLSGATFEQQIKSLKGTVSFEVKNGSYGDSISFSRFLNAVNVISLSGFKQALQSANSKLGTTDTQDFQDMTGILTFNNGVANVSSFKSKGPSMSLYASGSYNILNNYANLKITGRVSSRVAGLLGTLGTDKIQTTVEKVSTVAQNAVDKVASNLINSDNKGVQAGLKILGAIKQAQQGQTTAQGTTQTAPTEQKTAGQIVSKIIQEKANPLFGAISAGDLANVPALSTNETENTKNFQVTINGLITNPRAVKSLKFANN